MTATASSFDAKLLSSSAADALGSLSQAGAKAVELVEAWVKAGNAAAVAEAAERAEGAARKAARRGLNVLKARGVAVPEQARVSAVSGEKSPEQTDAFLLAPDSMGNVLIAIATRSLTSRGKVAFVYMNDELGIHRVDVGELSQSQLKDALAKALPGARYKAVSVPVEWARRRIADARGRHAQSNVPEPLGFSRAKDLLEPVPSEPVAHPFDGEGLELSLEDAADMVKASAQLHNVAELAGWFPDKGAVDELFAFIGKNLSDKGHDPAQEPPAEALQSAMSEEIASATDRYFTPERRARLLMSLKDAALSALSREGEATALQIAALTKVVEEAGLITNPPHEIPFLRGYFEKAVSLLAMQNQGRIRIPVPPRAPEAAAT
ncbi:MAG: alginate regulatory protein AlgP [Polyangiaceae bacterium]|jgi:hypothetical protein|nr:alginate regulatory protein AlgP [Polyangiaceae bacterium]